MGNRNNTTNKTSTDDDQNIIKMYSRLINMGFNEDKSMRAASKYPNNLNKAIDYINNDQHDPKTEKTEILNTDKKNDEVFKPAQNTTTNKTSTVDQSTRLDELRKMRIRQLKKLLQNYISSSHTNLKNKYNSSHFIEKSDYVNAIIQIENNLNAANTENTDSKTDDSALREFNNDCSDISSCKSLKRLMMLLQFYQSTINNVNDINSNKLFLEYIEGYKNILNDYGHLLCVHLDQETQEENDNIFAIIHNKCSKYINCSLDNCKHYTRNNRNRCEPNTKVVENNNNLLSIYTDILDTIHCYFLHSYDTGFRLIKNYKNEQKNDDTDKDNEMQYIQKEIKSKRKRLEMIRGLDCIQKTKFVIDISVDDTNDEKSADSVLYSFGQKFYYNDKDKNNENEDVSQWGLDVRHNRGYKIKDWYVGKKYENIKQEILTNKLYTLNATEYNDAVIKAVKFVKDSVILRNYATENVDKEVYVDADDTINAEHVLCLLLYTDYTNLQYHFSKTFRKINSKETNEQFKQRKREFYWWSKILIQTVQSFGTDMIQSNVNVYYTGISSPVIFNSFMAYFYGPTSTSRQLAVSTIFAGHNGIILELERCHTGYFAKGFNCSLISAYGNEDERLFIGGYRPLQLRSIRLIENMKTYHVYIDAMNKLDTILNGKWDGDHWCKKQDVNIINKLSKHELKIDGYSNEFPSYINDLFHQFVLNKKYINIVMKSYIYIHEGAKYYLFSEMLFSSKCVSLLKYGFISSLFKQCQEISIDYKLGSGTCAHSEMATAPLDFDVLLEDIKIIISNEKSSLKTIKLINYPISVDNTTLEQFKNSLDTLHWSVMEENNVVSIQR